MDVDNNEKPTDIDLGNILKAMDSLSQNLEELFLQSQLKLCDLIICVGRPDKHAAFKVQETHKQQQQQATQQDQ